MKIHIMGKVMRIFTDKMTNIEMPEGIEMMEIWIDGNLISVKRREKDHGKG